MINFVTDFIYLYSALCICKLRRRTIPILTSAVLGGVYSVIWLFMTDIHLIFQMIIHISVLILICAIAVPANDAKTVFKTSSVFFVINAFGGGIISSIFSMSGRYFIFGGGIYADISPLIFLAFTLIIIALSVPLFVKTKNKLSSKTVSVFLMFQKKSSSLDALIDSGNLLTDPISNDGIMLIKHNSLNDFFSYQQLCAIKELNVLSENFPTGIRLVSSDRGLIPVFRPEKAEIKLFGVKGKKDISILVGIDFSSGSFGGVGGLIPAQYID